MLLQGVIAVQAAAVLGCLVQCSRARSAVWAAGGGSTLLPALLEASPLALSGKQPFQLFLKAKLKIVLVLFKVVLT